MWFYSACSPNAIIKIRWLAHLFWGISFAKKESLYHRFRNKHPGEGHVHKVKTTEFNVTEQNPFIQVWKCKAHF